jgi:hypothetical protein
MESDAPFGVDVAGPVHVCAKRMRRAHSFNPPPSNPQTKPKLAADADAARSAPLPNEKGTTPDKQEHLCASLLRRLLLEAPSYTPHRAAPRKREAASLEAADAAPRLPNEKGTMPEKPRNTCARPCSGDYHSKHLPTRLIGQPPAQAGGVTRSCRRSSATLK